MLKRRVKKLVKRIAVDFFSNASTLPDSAWSIEKDAIFYKFRNFVRDVRYDVSYEPFPASICKHKWVGAQILNDKICFIPNDETSVLVKQQDTWQRIGNLPNQLFKWTGGCVWNNHIYAFPRSANSFLKIGQSIEEIPLTITYEGEHHYSGVCTKDGVVYQPPRNTNHILKTDLKTGKSTKIDIINDYWHLCYRCCGSIIHPNGFIYFFPENGERVIKLDPSTDKWCFIGEKISVMCFDAKVGLDGNIYGFSAYRPGLMKIDVINDRVEMIHKEIIPGAYGTKYGLDGCLYSVPGVGAEIWKYDVLRDKVEKICNLHSSRKAKYAGAVVLKNGCIICCPAEEEKVLVLTPNIDAAIENEVYNTFFADNY